MMNLKKSKKSTKELYSGFDADYDAVKDAAMMPFAATDFSSHKGNFEKCLEAGKFIGVQEEGTFAEERKALEKLYKSFER